VTGRLFYPGTPVSTVNQTYHHDIAEILLKVALNTKTLFQPYFGAILNEYDTAKLSKNSGNNCRVLFFKKKEEDKTSKQKKIGMKVRRYQSKV
jgi:hypothetical protein